MQNFQNNSGCTSWLILIGGFYLLSSVVSVLTGVLGFPSLFTLIVLGGMLATFAYLYYRKYAMRSWWLVACVGGLLVCTLALVRGFTVQQPNPEDYAFSDVSLDNIIATDEDTTRLTAYDDYYYEEDVFPEPSVTILFPPVETLEGQWRFLSGEVRVTGAINGTFQADNLVEEPGGRFTPLPESRLRPVEPSLYVSLPLDSLSDGEALTLDASLTLQYWAEGGEIRETTLQRQITATMSSFEGYYPTTTDIFGLMFGVGDPLFYEEAVYRYETARGVVEGGGWIALTLGNIASVAAAFVLIRRYRVLDTPGMRDSMFQFVRRSGAQKLGIESYPIKRMADQHPEKNYPAQGVYIGRVEAQSPAGRAGFRTQDVLLTLRGEAVKSPGQANRIAAGMKRGQTIPATLWRDGEVVELTVRF